MTAIAPNGKDTWKRMPLAPGHPNLELAECQGALLGAHSSREGF